MAKKSKSKKSAGYFGCGHLLSIILAIFPLTNIIFGIVIRAKKNNIIGVILNIFLAPLFYIIDLITIIISNKVSVLA